MFWSIGLRPVSVVPCRRCPSLAWNLLLTKDATCRRQSTKLRPGYLLVEDVQANHAERGRNPSPGVCSTDAGHARTRRSSPSFSRLEREFWFKRASNLADVLVALRRVNDRLSRSISADPPHAPQLAQPQETSIAWSIR